MRFNTQNSNVRKIAICAGFSFIFLGDIVEAQFVVYANPTPVNTDVLRTKDFSSSPNSYIFNPEDTIHDGIFIPLAKPYQLWSKGRYMEDDLGNFISLSLKNQSASVYWEDVQGLIKSVSIDNEFGLGKDAQIKVIIDKSKGKGNAVIAFKNNGEIYWSWHIWVTDSPENGSSYAQGFETDRNGKSFVPEYMDRNLGATNAKFLGNDWEKSGGLMYQWGRKDPIPPLVYKDGLFYEVTGEVGAVRSLYAANSQNSISIPILFRGVDTGSNKINDNIKFSIKHPLNIITHALQDGTWFSDKEYKTNNADSNKIETWDLWSDNRAGLNSNVNSSDPKLAAESKSYNVKSEYDPCPNGWRVPSHFGRNTINNNQNPFGRKNSSENDDVIPENNFIKGDVENDKLAGIKVYPGLGFDFTNATRSLGLITINGNYEYYGPDAYGSNYLPTRKVIYQDQGSDGSLGLATYGVGGVRNFIYISSPEDIRFGDAGWNALYVNQIAKTNGAGGVRCMRDPNTINFPTQYVDAENANEPNYKEWMKEPNSFVVMTGDLIESAEDKIITISLKKAYAMQNLLNDANAMSSGNLKNASVEWTTNKSLIKNLKIIGVFPDEMLQVTLAANEKGNAVVAFRKGSNGVWNESDPDKVLWSWHIWAPVTNPLDETSAVSYTTESLENGGIIPTTNSQIINATKSINAPLTTEFMDRNLGALYALPGYLYRPNLVEELKSKTMIQQSGGMQYQWGRKDPLPTFHYPGGTQFIAGHPNSVKVSAIYNVYKQINADSFGNIIYDANPITENKFTSTDINNGYAREWNYYKTASGITNTDPKNIKIKKVIKYSVENPLSYLYTDRTGNEIGVEDVGTLKQKAEQVKDWVSDESGQFSERWGHATEKSPYDPCPEGWRVPDTSSATLSGGNINTSYAKGSSPWFYNGYNTDQNFNMYGIAQNGIADLTGNTTNNAMNVKSYPGYALTITTESNSPSSRSGWVFNFANSKYNIGNIPTTGIRGIIGGSDWKNPIYASAPTADNYRYQTGLWTSSAGDFYTGYAIGLNLSSVSGYGGKLASGTGFYPQAAMGVRCARDTERYMGDLPYTNKPQQKINFGKVNKYLAQENNLNVVGIKMYPVSVKDFLFMTIEKDINFKVFDISGKIVLMGKTKNKSVDMSSLLRGVYIIVINDKEIISKKIIKN